MAGVGGGRRAGPVLGAQSPSEMMPFCFAWSFRMCCLWKKLTEVIPRESICGYTKDKRLEQLYRRFRIKLKQFMVP